MKLAHSYTSIKQFEQCPLRYYRQRILKDVKDIGSSASVYGDRVHKAFEARLRGQQPATDDADKHEALCQSFEQLAERWGGTLEPERELVLNNKLEPTGWWEPDAWLRSKLDVFILAGDKAAICDLKTGARRPDMFQMALFAAQVFVHFPKVEKCTTALVWLKSGELDKETYHRKQANHLWVDILSRIRRIHEAAQTDNWPARPSGLCGWCPCEASCPYARKK